MGSWSGDAIEKLNSFLPIQHGDLLSEQKFSRLQTNSAKLKTFENMNANKVIVELINQLTE